MEDSTKFESSTIAVQCGSNTAQFHLAKFERGNKGDCVRFDNSWLTPNMFQAVSGKVSAKDWKKSIKHHGRSLKLLIEKHELCLESSACRCEMCIAENRRDIETFKAEAIVPLQVKSEATTIEQKSEVIEPCKVDGRRKRGRRKKRRNASAARRALKRNVDGSADKIDGIESPDGFHPSTTVPDVTQCPDDDSARDGEVSRPETEVDTTETALDDSRVADTAERNGRSPVPEVSDENQKENSVPVVALVSTPQRPTLRDDMNDVESQQGEVTADIADVTSAKKPTAECERISSAVELLKHLRGSPRDQMMMVTSGDDEVSTAIKVAPAEQTSVNYYDATSSLRNQHGVTNTVVDQPRIDDNDLKTHAVSLYPHLTPAGPAETHSPVLARLLAPTAAEKGTAPSSDNESETPSANGSATHESPGKEARLLNIIRELKTYKKQLMKNIDMKCHTTVKMETTDNSYSDLTSQKDHHMPMTPTQDDSISNLGSYWRPRPVSEGDMTNRLRRQHISTGDVDSTLSSRVLADATALSTAPCLKNTRITPDSTGILDLSSGKRKSTFCDRDGPAKRGAYDEDTSSSREMTHWSSPPPVPQSSSPRRGAKIHPSRRNISAWSADDVYRFVLSNPVCSAYAEDFRQHLVTGRILRHLSVDQMMRILRTSQTAAQCLRKRVDHVLRSTKSAGCRLR